MKTRTRTIWVTYVLVVLLGGLLVSCGPAPVATPAPPEDTAIPPEDTAAPPEDTAIPPTPVPAPKVMNIGPIWEPKGLQPESQGVALMRYGVMETLLGISFEDELGPGLATSWEQVDDLTWRFNLQSGVKFHNGQPCDAEAARFALDHAFTAEGTKSGLKGAAVEVEDEDTILIRTAEPSMIVPALLADWTTGILAEESFDAEGNVTTPIGTGPFKFVEWVQGERFVVEKFADYWGGVPGVDKTVFQYIPDGHTRATMLQTAELDIVRGIPLEDAATLQGDANLTVIVTPLRRFRALYLNNSQPPFDDLRVRQAMNHAIDKEALLQYVLEGYGTVAEGPFKPGLPWTPDLEGYAYDPDKAKDLLEQAGYSEGDLSFTIVTYPGRPELATIAEVVQEQLRQVGVTVDIQVMEYSPMEEMLLAGNYEAAALARNPAYRVFDPHSFFVSDYTTDGGFNLSHYSNPQVDDLMEQASGEKDSQARYELYQQVQQIIVDEDAVDVFFNYYVQIDGYREGVVGYRTHPTEFLIITEDVGFE